MDEEEVADHPLTSYPGLNEETTVNGTTSLAQQSPSKQQDVLEGSPQANGNSCESTPPTVNGFSEQVQDDLLLEIDQMVTEDNDELSSLRLQINKLESANKRLEDQLSEISKQKEEEIERCNESIRDGQSQNHALQKTIASQLSEINMWKERVESNDRAARKAIDGYKTEHQTNMDKIMKKYNECKAERESMVVKYAQGEAKISQLQSSVDKLELRVKDREREKQVLAEKFKNLKSESEKQSTNVGAKVSELSALRKEIDTHKESISSHEYRTKWAQNKLRSEIDAHKETKAKLEEVTRRFKESKEECVTIRTNCQEMIKTYQESEEIKSNSLDIELKKKEAELQEKSVSIRELTQNLESMKAELNKASKQADIFRKQSGAGEEKVEELEKTNNLKLKELDDLNACTQSLREENSQIRLKLQEMQSLQQEVELKNKECLDMQGQVATVNQLLEEHEADMEACKKRDAEMLALTQKMTERNAELQSENSALKSKLTGVGITSSQREDQITSLEESLRQQEKKLQTERSTAQLALEKAQTELAEQAETIEKLNSDIDGYQSEIRMLKKKQVSSVKELTREVHTLKRQLEAYESKHLDENIVCIGRQSSPARDGSTSLQHSRANSTSSLDKPDSWVMVDRQQAAAEPSKPQPPADTVPSSDSLDPQFLEPDKQKMIEKIVKLQKLNARKNEKLDFCQEHISQLIEEIQKKTRIIQMYAMRDHVGGLSSDAMEINKSTIAKKGGIMASISKQQSKDESLNLQLSLKINNQLQALFEDTLLKNITLKENMDTLGREIERISAENASLKDQISQHEAQIT